MSGGVDSSLAAALLVEQGYDCVGVTMQVWPDYLPEAELEGGCCSLSAVEDARQVAARLGMPHYVANFRAEFQEKVIDNFVAEYAAGRTPNPCLVCNREIKFRALLERALELGANYVATGHYARVQQDPITGRFLLLRGIDLTKDQSYALHNLTQDQLKRALFPLGWMTKEKTRALARKKGLRVADKPDSQEICFVPGNDYRRFLREHAPGAYKPGPILSLAGETLGQHDGIAFYTIGQRHGLGIAAEQPLYVVDIDPDENAVIVGSKDDVWQDGLIASDVNWVAVPALKEPLSVQVKIRYNSQPMGCIFRPTERDAGADISARVAGTGTRAGERAGEVECLFSERARAVTPGQAAVFYDGDVVVGGGAIVRPIVRKGPVPVAVRSLRPRTY